MVSLPLVSIWKERTSILFYAILNIKLRFASTQLGLLWAGLEPLFYFIIMYVVFSTIRQRETDFAIYLLTGILFFHIFSRGTSGGITSLTKNSSLLESLNINKEIFPVVATVAIGLLSIVHLIVFLGLMPVFQFIPAWTMIFLPIPFALVLILILGMNYILSISSVYFKDIKHLWSILVHALLFICPIFWRLDQADEVLLTIQKINPLGQIIEISHSLVISGEIPPLYDWLYTSAFIFGIFIIGFIIFKKFENKIIEEF